MPVSGQILLSNEWMRTAQRKLRLAKRRQAASRIGRFALSIFASFLLIILMVASWGLGHWYYQPILLILLFLTWFGDWLASYSALCSFRRHPAFGGSVDWFLDHDVIKVVDQFSSTAIKWAKFKRAVHFRDGVLLIQLDELAYWLPFEGLKDGNPLEMWNFVRDRIDLAEEETPTLAPQANVIRSESV